MSGGGKDCTPCKWTPIFLYLASAGYVTYHQKSFGRIPSLIVSTGCILLAGHHFQKNILAREIEKLDQKERDKKYAEEYDGRHNGEYDGRHNGEYDGKHDREE